MGFGLAQAKVVIMCTLKFLAQCDGNIRECGRRHTISWLKSETGTSWQLINVDSEAEVRDLAPNKATRCKYGKVSLIESLRMQLGIWKVVFSSLVER